MNPLRAIDRLFYAVFGQTRNVDLMVVSPADQHPEWTKNLFKIAFGIYMLVTVVVLVKLLIATMSDTYQQIQAQSDIEWKFGLSKLVRNIHRTTTAPSPINLITTWLFILKDVLNLQVLNHRLHQRPSPASRAARRWLRIVRKRVTSTSSLKNDVRSHVTHAIQQKKIENVVNWKDISRKYRAVMEIKKRLIEEGGDVDMNLEGLLQ